MILLMLMLFRSFIYFSTIFRSEETTILLVVIITLLLSKPIYSVETLDFTPFRSLLMFEMYLLACEMTSLELLVLIGMIISRGIFSSYIKFGFILWFYVISDIVNFNNFFRRQFGKNILNFDYISFRDLYI